MLPDFSRNNRVNSRGCDVEAAGDCGQPTIPSRYIRIANLTHDSLSDHGHRVVFAPVIVPTFLAVLHVIGRRSKIKMIRTHTWRVVAFVQNLQVVGDRAVSAFPRDLMRWANAAFAVAVLILEASPKPACLRFFDSRPKPNYRSGAVLRVVALLRTKSVSIFARPTNERVSTSLASVCYFRSSQGVNLRDRFANWLGSFAVQPAFEPFVF